MNKAFDTNSQSLNDWLFYLESIHPQEIELGLDRVREVALKLNLLSELNHVILVGGTNGKGSTSAYLEHLILASGATTGVFSSPHLIKYNERLRINGEDLADNAHIEAFQAIEKARADVSLTYFEVNTLSALYLMKKANVDYLILEVGLGGRLDSTNIVDADMSIITSIDLDHQSWLGDTRELVAYEKAGIFRTGQQVICGEPNPPQPLLEKAIELGCAVQFKGKDFNFEDQGEKWCFSNKEGELNNLPLTKLPMTNAATALAALDRLGIVIPQQVLISVIEETSLNGRLQKVSDKPTIYLDVAHNPEAGRYLAAWIARQKAEKVHCVCAMLGDKDSAATLEVLKPHVDQWYLGGLSCARGATSAQLSQSLSVPDAKLFDNVVDALSMAQRDVLSSNKVDDELIIVFGSFFTVAEVLEHKQKQ